MTPPKTLEDWLPWLESLSPREIVLGLERVQEVLGRLDLRRPELVVNVAGTNGKGSCVALLESLARANGLHTGAYTSPHLVHYNERTRVDGVPADDATIIAALARVESARKDVPLTYFEFTTLASLVVFDEAAVDAWFLEVGMGGRLDAVNAIDPDGALITNISLDHCAWLGDSVEAIAAEKAGVMRPGRPVVFGSDRVPRAIADAAAEKGATLLRFGHEFNVELTDESHWTWRDRGDEIAGIELPAIGGRVQVRNAATVIALLRALDLGAWCEPPTINRALGDVRLDGRFQVVDQRYLLDVAHNPAAAEQLADEIRAANIDGRLIAIVGMLNDKDVAGFVSPLDGLVDHWIAVGVSGTRTSSAMEIATTLANTTGRPCLLADDVRVGLAEAERLAGNGDRILITGSFFVVGPALEALEFCRRSGAGTAA